MNARKTVSKLPLVSAAVLGLTLLSALPAAAAAEPEIAAMSSGPAAIVWQPAIAYERMVLTVSGPDGVFSREFDAATIPSLDLYDDAGFPLADGSYTWELRAEPVISRAARRALEQARATGDMTRVDALRRSGELPIGPLVTGGHFQVDGGAFVRGDLDEDAAAGEAAVRSTTGAVRSTHAADQVIPDDLIVNGSSLCVGFDCVNGEAFGFDTIRLKENNTRILFMDTSVGTFPTTDWQLVANDSASGGLNKFSIEDVTSARLPFTIEGGATTNSIYVDSTGRVGFRTSTPVLDLHVNTANTPGIRLEQNGSGGFTAQTWDIAGNEANFFVRDVTSGSRLPFRIRPGAPTSALDVSAAGNVGIGTGSPLGGSNETGLHVLKTGATAEVLLKLESNAPTTRFTVENQNDTTCAGGTNCSWSVGMRQNSSFIITRDGSGSDECTITTAGNFSCIGTVGSSSSREVKSDIVPVDPRDMLARVMSLPLAEWTYDHEVDAGVRHVGPIAEDFYATFGLGFDDKHLAPMDTSGVALAAIQGLNQVIEEKDRRLEELEADNAELSARLAALERLVEAMGSR